MVKKIARKSSVSITEAISEEKREEMIKQFLPLVRRVVHRMASRLPNSVDTDEMMTSGMIGLVDALAKFDKKQETSFLTYAQIRIRGAILDSFRDQDWMSRTDRIKINQLKAVVSDLEVKLGRQATAAEIAAKLKIEENQAQKMLDKLSTAAIISFDDFNFEHGEEHLSQEYISSDNINNLTNFVNPLGSLIEEERTTTIAKAIEKLPYNEKLVISLYFYEELNLKEIGQIIGVTESRASQIRTAALRKLGDFIENA